MQRPASYRLAAYEIKTHCNPVQIPGRPLKLSKVRTEIVMLAGVQHVFITAQFQSVY
jgi:hypothetical protein